jgi:hypothetical protein
MIDIWRFTKTGNVSGVAEKFRGSSSVGGENAYDMHHMGFQLNPTTTAISCINMTGTPANTFGSTGRFISQLTHIFTQVRHLVSDLMNILEAKFVVSAVYQRNNNVYSKRYDHQLGS